VGKNSRPTTPNLDGGDHVIVLNAGKVAVSRAQLDAKIYARHSGYPRDTRRDARARLLERRPEEAVRRAVKGMFPHRLGAQQLRKLKIYAGPDHPHQAQRPEPLG